MKETQKLNESATVWGIHCAIDKESIFLDNNVIAIGWREMGDLSRIAPNRDAYKKAFSEIFPNASKNSAANQVGQLYRCVCEAKIGDYVVFPSKLNRSINIGQIEGAYFHNPSESRFVQQRKVKWIRTAISRTNFSQGALHAIGSAMTFFQISDYADEFLAARLGKENKVIDHDPTITHTAETIETESRDYILKQLQKKYKGYPFEEVVEDLLRAMGYANTSVSPHGGDHGKDIIVYKDELPPRIVVQVKSQDDPIPERMLQQLNGCLEGGDYGVFVALSPFTDNALKFISKTPRIKAIDGEEFLDLFLRYYDQLDDDIREAIPLKKVYIPVAPREETQEGQ